MKIQVSYTKQATTVAASVGLMTSCTVADPVDPSRLECEWIANQAEIASNENETTQISRVKVRIPVTWDKKAEKRLDELFLLKAQQKTSAEEDVEFQELYDAREDALDETSTEERIKEFKNRQALQELLDAFDHYVLTKEITH